MVAAVDVKTVLKRGALVAAANWQVTAIQFMAESTFKMLLSVPVVGGVLLVVLVLGRELPELFSADIRESATFVATALAAEPPALISFLVAFGIVGLAGFGVHVPAEGRHGRGARAAEREAAAVEEPPLRLEPFWTAARFSVDRYDDGLPALPQAVPPAGPDPDSSSTWRPRRVSRGAAARRGVVHRRATRAGRRSPASAPPCWSSGSRSSTSSTCLIQMVVVVEDCSVRSAARRVWKFLRAEPKLTFGVFGVLLLLVVGATIVSLIATTSLGLIAFVPLAGLAVVPLQLLAWLFRGLVFQFLGLSALSAYLTLYRRYR